jgi:hypothetical protein
MQVGGAIGIRAVLAEIHELELGDRLVRAPGCLGGLSAAKGVFDGIVVEGLIDEERPTQSTPIVECGIVGLARGQGLVLIPAEKVLLDLHPIEILTRSLPFTRQTGPGEEAFP